MKGGQCALLVMSSPVHNACRPAWRCFVALNKMSPGPATFCWLEGDKTSSAAIYWRARRHFVASVDETLHSKMIGACSFCVRYRWNCGRSFGQLSTQKHTALTCSRHWGPCCVRTDWATSSHARHILLIDLGLHIPGGVRIISKYMRI